MRNMIDRSLSEVRMRADPIVHISKFDLLSLVDQILITAQSEARIKKQILKNEISNEIDIELETDRHLLLSAIANLIQNALKFSKAEGLISVRAAQSGNNAVIEIEDECGGIPTEVANNLFKPFTSGGFENEGLGLGLTIVQRAVFLLQGKVSFRNNSGNGCAFLIEIPMKLVPIILNKAVSGEDSAQPDPQIDKK